MSLDNKGNTTLILNLTGIDSWSRPVYQDQFGHLWKDVSFGFFGQPLLCSATGDELDGEPGSELTQEYTIQTPAYT